jgi:hypothetical protein
VRRVATTVVKQAGDAGQRVVDAVTGAVERFT